MRAAVVTIVALIGCNHPDVHPVPIVDADIIFGDPGSPGPAVCPPDTTGFNECTVHDNGITLQCTEGFVMSQDLTTVDYCVGGTVVCTTA